MAITKLMHMKEAPGRPHDHLKNSIEYILDVKHGGKKTAWGQLVGGNSGTDHEEILENFLETKREYGKTDGRQGYHFVISFAKGETEEGISYKIIKEFCEQYLGDNYDYVFAVHNDKEHLHGHIIFNSVSRTDGSKYHYKKGDWEKHIQPITDGLCVEHGLSALTFSTERTGVSYASWAAEHEGKLNWTHIIRADVDYAIQQAGSFEEFQTVLQNMNYQIRTGYSQKRKAAYLTFCFLSQDGKEHRRRSYRMAEGYSPQEIRQRIQTKEGSKSYEDIVNRLSRRAAGYGKPAVLKSVQTYKRLYQAVSYYKLPNPYAVPAEQVRKDMLRLDRLLEECTYLKINQVKGEKELEKRRALLDKKQKELLANRKKLYGIQDGMEPEKLQAMEEYHQLQKRMTQEEQKGSDLFEEIEEQMLQMERLFPPELLEVKSRIENYGKEIADIRKEIRLLQRIQKTEMETGMPVQELQRKM